MTTRQFEDYKPTHIDIELDPSDLNTSAPRLICSVKVDWMNKTICSKKLTDGLSNTLFVMFPQAEDEQAIIVRIYGVNSDLIVDREAEIRAMIRLSQYDMANKVLLTFNNGFISSFVAGEQINIQDENIK
ncbi:unnamed protein product [Rotaria sp. Silwood1]|nr:unnamed protein product [Rotaria sp. Silwood1]